MYSLLLAATFCQSPDPPKFPTAEDLKVATRVIGLEFESEELQQMQKELRQQLASLEAVRNFGLPWDQPFSLGFNPLRPGMEIRSKKFTATEIALPDRERPEDLNALAFLDIPTLAGLIRSRKVSCVELAELSLERLERHNASLNCVVTLTRKRALAQAKALDAELEAGEWRGMLHGIPYGAKDLLAAKGYPTTFGAMPFKEQVLDMDASVIRRLDRAGAVLVAKLSLGCIGHGRRVV